MEVPPPPGFDIVGYHPRKKIHVITRVVFQDQSMYGRTSFRGAKTYKIGKKGVFLIILTNLEKDMMKNWEKRMQKRVFRVYFHTWKIWVCFKSPFTRMISSLKYKWPPPRGWPPLPWYAYDPVSAVCCCIPDCDWSLNIGLVMHSVWLALQVKIIIWVCTLGFSSTAWLLSVRTHVHVCIT